MAANVAFLSALFFGALWAAIYFWSKWYSSRTEIMFLRSIIDDLRRERFSNQERLALPEEEVDEDLTKLRKSSYV